MMRVCWACGPGGGNVGDMITPYILSECGILYKRATSTTPNKHVMCGSIMVWTQNGDTVWGTGNSHMTLNGKIGKNLNILAVRGPMTRARIIVAGQDCPDVYGDPGLLLPRFYTPKVEKKHKVGLVPHYVDWALDTFPKTLPWINPLWLPVPRFIDAICECERILSSSLHGLIIAHAYGIPARWVQGSKKVYGDGLKFRDYLKSVQHPLYEPEWTVDPDDFLPAFIDIDLDRLWSVRPWA